MLNLDTHILIHALDGSLTPRERKLLSGDRWGISAIVLWELAKFHELGRIRISVHSADLAQALSRITVWPLNLMICRTLDQLDFRSDPADEIIAATSLAHNVPLVTRDRRIRASKIVEIA